MFPTVKKVIWYEHNLSPFEWKDFFLLMEVCMEKLHDNNGISIGVVSLCLVDFYIIKNQYFFQYVEHFTSFILVYKIKYILKQKIYLE